MGNWLVIALASAGVLLAVLFARRRRGLAAA